MWNNVHTLVIKCEGKGTSILKLTSVDTGVDPGL